MARNRQHRQTKGHRIPREKRERAWKVTEKASDGTDRVYFVPVGHPTDAELILAGLIPTPEQVKRLDRSDLALLAEMDAKRQAKKEAERTSAPR